ncbi:26S proteasome non-ATPase regulatory subunit 9 [Papilio xuthus]|uniref:26S proteasome non-ATPase regulatory subunit 9 n=1 Tax=Papilio xuthus TaxID=66420 RepID=A0A194Q5A2_PAPXU|nr:26S proteasome non-ATPase regulatory subunit 9 [Papilio xuthus]
MVGINMDGPSRERVMKLIEEKDRIEREIQEQSDILATNNVGMHDSLVDSDGYPRNDIDVYKVRHTRHQIICLQNDHKAIMKRIEEGLYEVHSEFRGSSNTGTSQQATSATYTNGHAINNINRTVTEDRCFAIVGFVHDGSTRHQIICLQNDHKAIMKRIEEGLYEVHSEFRGSSNTGTSQQATSATYTNGHAINNINRTVTEDRCFAIVGFVHDGSPADLAGLLQNDKILQFGSINHSNFSDVTQVHQIVSHSVGQRIEVRVKRDQNVISLSVVPRPWTHPGLLGCQIRRYTES